MISTTVRSCLGGWINASPPSRRVQLVKWRTCWPSAAILCFRDSHRSYRRLRTDGFALCSAVSRWSISGTVEGEAGLHHPCQHPEETLGHRQGPEQARCSLDKQRGIQRSSPRCGTTRPPERVDKQILGKTRRLAWPVRSGTTANLS